MSTERGRDTFFHRSGHGGPSQARAASRRSASVVVAQLAAARRPHRGRRKRQSHEHWPILRRRRGGLPLLGLPARAPPPWFSPTPSKNGSWSREGSGTPRTPGLPSIAVGQWRQRRRDGATMADGERETEDEEDQWEEEDNLGDELLWLEWTERRLAR